jgi:hypothetical protein
MDRMIEEQVLDRKQEKEIFVYGVHIISLRPKATYQMGNEHILNGVKTAGLQSENSPYPSAWVKYIRS